MNEKVQQFMDKIDVAAEKTHVLPKLIDRAADLLKTPIVASIPAIINKITSKFSLSTIILFAAVYIIYCLKNALVAMAFENGPSGMAFGLAVAAVIATALSTYVVYKTMGIFDRIISTSECRISSLNIFSIMVIFHLFLALASLIGGIYIGIQFKSVQLIISGVIGAVFFFLMALYNSVPEEFAIVQDENASAGEDFTSIVTFSVKVMLRLVPIAVFVLPIIGIVYCFPEIFETYTVSNGSSNHLAVGVMISMMLYFGVFLLVGLLPLIAYIYYLASYITLDLIRAVLSIPGKLDRLNK